MRKFIIDTDTASDDAAAIMAAVLSKEIDLLGVTVVAGNVEVDQAAKNALMTLEICGSDAPVFAGAKRPLFRELKDTISVHGSDGMGDMDIIHPKRAAEDGRAVEFILDMANTYPGELEIVVLGPATNIALAMLTDRDAMRGVKRIWSMGTPGFGPGNATPVSEFNVFIDAEAYALMLDVGAPVVIAGFDLCTGDIGIDTDEMAYMAERSDVGRFLRDATTVLLEFNRRSRDVSMVDLPDAVAMAAALWPDFVTGSVKCHCKCCFDAGPTYGQVIFYQEGRTYEGLEEELPANAEVITSVDEKVFTKRFMDLIAGG